MSSWQHRLGRLRAKACARWFLGVVTVAAVALASIFGGQRYFYCRAMDQIMTHATCECAQSRYTEDERPASIRILNDCFDVRVFDRLVSSTMESDLGIPAAGLVGMLPARSLELRPSNAVLTGADHPIRAGPFSPTGVRAQLMVFLT